MKIIITGATGYLGRELIREISGSEEIQLYAATSDIKKAEALFEAGLVKIVSNDRILDPAGGLLDSDSVIIHAAFCRRPSGDELAKSLEFSRKLYQAAVECETAGILNISSQSLYGGGEAEKRNEHTQPSPGSLYAMAKCGSEELLNQAVYFSNGKTAGCNIRMASLMGPTDLVPDNVLYKFVCSALRGDPITIVGGTQKFSFLDVHDAAQAIIYLLRRPSQTWEPVYNLGPAARTGIVEMAELVRDEAEKYTGEKVEISVQPEEDHEVNAGMDSMLLYDTLHWRPAHTFADIVRDTVRFAAGQQGLI